MRELDVELQKVYIANSRTKSVYFRFLVNLFKKGFSDNSDIKYSKMGKANRRYHRNILLGRDVL